MIDTMEDVFRALADPTRRALLDELFATDGQTLVALAGRFDMTRVGVAKHLAILEDAGLVVSRRHGREKFHHLNPVPIREIHERWVSKYTEGWAAGLVELKHDMEDEMEKVFEIYIKTTPERLWHAITDPDIRAKYNFGARAESDNLPGSSFRLISPNASEPVGGGGDPRGRSAAPAGADHASAVERRRRGRGHVPDHLGDRAGRRLMPAPGDPRPDARRAPTNRSTEAGR